MDCPTLTATFNSIMGPQFDWSFLSRVNSMIQYAVQWPRLISIVSDTTRYPTHGPRRMETIARQDGFFSPMVSWPFRRTVKLHCDNYDPDLNRDKYGLMLDVSIKQISKNVAIKSVSWAKYIVWRLPCGSAPRTQGIFIQSVCVSYPQHTRTPQSTP
jgi:hypothetical protein